MVLKEDSLVRLFSITLMHICFYIQEAELAKGLGNGYKLDKSHALVVNILDDFERYMTVPDEWMPAEMNPYTPVVSHFVLLTHF